MNKSTNLMLSALMSSLLFSGCQTPPRYNEPNLGDLYHATLEKPTATENNTVHANQDNNNNNNKTVLSTQENIDQQLDIYRSARTTLQNQQTNPELTATLDAKILALAIQQADEQYSQSPDAPEIYNSVIASLHTWIANNKNTPQTQDFKYQLARLLSITGQTTDADSVLTQLHDETAILSGKRYQEVSFRIAEKAFSQREYQKAIDNYTTVITATTAENTNFEHRKQALYMRAWSSLQLNLFSNAAQDFLTLLTDESLRPSNPQMLDDIHRGFTLAINDAGGVTTIPDLVEMTTFEPVSMDIYASLINFYTQEKRWSEIINAYQTYQKQYPGTDNALTMADQLLAFLENNKQKASLRTEKARFIEQYATQSPKQAAQYALELAEYYRSEALAAHKNAQNSRSPETRNPQTLFAKSLQYYELYLQKLTSTSDHQIQFAYAETLIEADLIDQGRKVLNTIAQGDGALKIRQDAAYLSLTSLKTDSQHTQELNTKRKVASAFIRDFPQHEKSTNVLQWLMVDSFQQQHYKKALEYAVIAKNQYPQITEQAQRISADSYFALEQWMDAGESYTQLLTYAPQHEQAHVWKSNGMKAYYQAARQAAQQNTPQKALQLFARVYNSDVNPLAAAALYEAAIIASQLDDQKPLAIQLLTRYVQHNPDKSNTRDAHIALARLYKENQNWAAAAPHLANAASTMTDPRLKQTALLEVADLYFKADLKDKAMTAYTRLLRDINDPPKDQYESLSTARHRLIQLYEQSNQNSKALREMKTYITHDLNSPTATEESRTRAETYAIKLAEYDAQVYRKIPITGNLAQSFKRKQKAMEQAITSFKHLEAFETPHATAASNAGIGNLFAHLSKSLLEAPVPQGLSPLETEEYLILVEEQAFPFEEKAVEAHTKNITKLHQGEWHDGIEDSLETLRQLLPARFDKREKFEGAVTHAE